MDVALVNRFGESKMAFEPHCFSVFSLDSGCLYLYERQELMTEIETLLTNNQANPDLKISLFEA